MLRRIAGLLKVAGALLLAAAVLARAQESDPLEKAQSLSKQSQIESDAGHYSNALALAQKALASGEAALGSDAAYVGELFERLGSIEFLTGDREKAAADLDRAIRIDRATLKPNSQQLASALLGMGNVYIAASDYAKAEQTLQEALAIRIKDDGPESPEVANCLVTLALLHQRRGDSPRALVEAKHALAIDRAKLAPDDVDTLKAMDGLADVYFEMEDLPHAIPLLQATERGIEKKLGPDHPLIAHSLQNLGILARNQNQFPFALEYFWRAEKVREQALGLQHASTAALLVNIGNVYGQEGDFPRSIESYQRALSVLEKTAGPYHEWTLMTLGNLARAYAAQNDFANAIQYTARLNAAAETNLSLNLAVGSEHQRVALANKFTHHIARTISLNLSEAPSDPRATDLAAEIVLERKGRVLDAVADNMSTLRRRLDAEDQKLLTDLNDTLAALAKAAMHGPGGAAPEAYAAKLEELEHHKEELETAISRRSAGYYQKTDAVTLAAVRAAIPADSVLIEFAVYQAYNFRQFSSDQSDQPYRYAVYVISPSGNLRAKDLGDAREVDAQVEAYRRALRDPRRADVRQLARALDARLMQPLRSMGIAGKHLILSPDGMLNLLSFESLLDEQGHYLVENFAISYVTTGRDLLRMQVARSSRSEPVVVANPDFGDPDDTPARLKRTSSAVSRGGDELFFAPLTGTAMEAAELRILLPDARILTGVQASKSELEQVQAPNILHIATHGFFLGSAEPENPLLRSGLAFAGANLGKQGRANGILTALEASSLNLWGTKLVTLSACDTGVGEVRNGDGVYGLRRAFLIAGAETVMTSLWPVSDAITRELMTGYYRELKAGTSRGDALRNAQLAMLHKKGREHPFYWASFIQVGEWRGLGL